jgi:hypothetical protein
VEAICWWPNEVRMVWETDAAHVEAVAEEVARQLEQGYEHLAPANATFVGFTDPPAGPGSALLSPWLASGSAPP